MITFKKIYTTFFFLGLFLIPFNDFEGLEFLGEYRNESATYFFLLGFVFVVIDSFFKKKINFPYKHPLIIILGIFIFWTFLTIVFNYQTVSENFFKQTTGIKRYIRQTISLLISALCFTFLFWNVMKNYTLEECFNKIRKVLFWSFVFVAIYGSFEIGILFFKMRFLRPIWDLFEYLPFINNSFSGGGRMGISSVTFEPPSLGNYLIFVFPWMISYIFTEKTLLKFIPSVVAIILMFFSDSRVAFIVMTIQLICLILLLLKDVRYRKITTFGLRLITIVACVIIFSNSENIYKLAEKKIDSINFQKNLTKNVSNKSRFGMQYAALEVFKENPICGVGFAQGAYQMRYHYPYWATSKNWEFKEMYKNKKNKSFPPTYNMYTRLLAETGIIGAFLFASLMFLSIYFALSYWKKTNFKYKHMGVVMVLSFVGFAMNWLQMDFFRQYGFWIMIIFLLKTLHEFNKNELINKQR